MFFLSNFALRVKLLGFFLKYHGSVVSAAFCVSKRTLWWEIISETFCVFLQFRNLRTFSPDFCQRIYRAVSEVAFYILTKFCRFFDNSLLFIIFSGLWARKLRKFVKNGFAEIAKVQSSVWKIILTVFFRENEEKKLSLWGSVQKFNWFLSKVILQIRQNCNIHVLRSLPKIFVGESFQIISPSRKKCESSLTLTKNFRYLYQKCILHVQFNVVSKKNFFSDKNTVLSNLGHWMKCFLILATIFRHCCQRCSLPP